MLEPLFESAPEGIVFQHTSGIVVRANREFCRMFGYTSEEVIGKYLADLISSDAERPEATALCKHVTAGGNFSIESIRRRKDGTAIDVSILGTPVRADGNQVGVYVIYRDITERKRAEQALIESESRFRAVTDTAASAIFIHTQDRFLYVNRTTEAITGYTREELLRMSPFDLVHPSFRPMLQSRAKAKAESKDVPSRYEFRIVTKSGAERWIDFNSSVIKFGGQNSTVSVAIDITQRKRGEQLQASLYRIADCAAYTQDLQDLYRSVHRIVAELIYANNFYIAVYDEQEGMLSWPYFVDEQDTIPPAPRKLRRGLTEYVIRSGTPLLATAQVFEKLLAKGEIELIGAPSIDWLGIPLKSGEKTFGAIVVQSYSENFRYGPTDQGILTFVSQHVASAIEHKRDQQALRESEERYRSLFERAAYGICRMAADGQIIDANPAMATMIGCASPLEAKNLSIRNDLSIDSEEFDHYASRFHDSRSGNVETRWKRVDGKIITVTVSVQAVLGPQETPEIFELIVEDISDRRALELQFRHAQKMEAVGRLAGGVAHDFNNLLTVIKGYSELMLDQLMEADPIRSQVDEIRKAADRAAALTRQLLAFSRRQVLAPKVLDLNAAIFNMEKLLRRLIGEDVELVCKLFPEVGRIKADPGQIEQVLMNFAVNARDAMPDGGRLIIETANVDFTHDWIKEQGIVKAGHYVVISVTDTGTGMDEETRSHVFEPFFTTKERGTGLGLSTVYGIVKQSGGYVFVQSEAGHGSAFKVYLPSVDEQPESTEHHADSNALYRGTETILIVEDEAGVRSLIRQMLERHGYNVIEARNGGEAFLTCERYTGPIHLLVTDVVLDHMSGTELAERLSKVRQGIPTLYISGYTEDAILRHGVIKPGMEFLQKPFTAEALALRIRTVLDRLRSN